MTRRAREQTQTTRRSYVQSSLMWGRRGGISLADLRDLVAATADYEDGSRVILEPNRVEVVETMTSPWAERGAAKEGT